MPSLFPLPSFVNDTFGLLPLRGTFFSYGQSTRPLDLGFGVSPPLMHTTTTHTPLLQVSFHHGGTIDY